MAENETKQSPRPTRDVRTGVVDSLAGSKTVRVILENLVRHPLYGKYMRRKTQLLVHDAQQQAGAGDVVEVASCRPISKRKSWRLVRVVRKASGE